MKVWWLKLTKTCRDDEIAKAAEKEPKGTEAIIIVIRQIQKDIDSRPKTYSQHANRDTEFNNFKGRLPQCADRFSEAVSDVRRNQQDMARVRLALFELRDAKAHPTLTPAILGSGPEGAGTAITKDLIQEHSEVLAAKTSFVALNDSKAALGRLEKETRRVRTENEDVKQLMESDGEQAWF